MFDLDWKDFEDEKLYLAMWFLEDLELENQVNRFLKTVQEHPEFGKISIEVKEHDYDECPYCNPSQPYQVMIEFKSDRLTWEFMDNLRAIIIEFPFTVDYRD